MATSARKSERIVSLMSPTWVTSSASCHNCGVYFCGSVTYQKDYCERCELQLVRRDLQEKAFANGNFSRAEIRKDFDDMHKHCRTPKWFMTSLTICKYVMSKHAVSNSEKLYRSLSNVIYNTKDIPRTTANFHFYPLKQIKNIRDLNYVNFLFFLHLYNTLAQL